MAGLSKAATEARARRAFKPARAGTLRAGSTRSPTTRRAASASCELTHSALDPRAVRHPRTLLQESFRSPTRRRRLAGQDPPSPWLSTCCFGRRQAALIWLVRRLGEPLIRALGATGFGALTRILGFLILAIAVELVLTACSPARPDCDERPLSRSAAARAPRRARAARPASAP
ncbi:MAG: MarC family protein [Solirubrobacteraceae bacterium]